MTESLSDAPVWPLWRKIAFRFAFIYLLLYTAPWLSVSGSLPWLHLTAVTEYYEIGWDWAVRFFNTHFLNIAENLVPMSGSGDTSFGWAQLVFTLCLSIVGCALWSVLDNKRKNYETIDYWLRVSVRYYLSFFCLLYGLIKVFSLQMIFPNLSQLATPLGDLLPMRFSWLFIGYSTPYQVFSGVMETIAGLLLINRKTVTLGLITATGVFIHVFVLNMAYDIPVKLFSGHLLIFCIYLLSYELPRLIDFFILNRVSAPDSYFNVEFKNKWMRYGRIVAKLTFITIAFILPVQRNYEQHQQVYNPKELKPIKKDVYNVELYVLNNKDTIPALVSDTLRWKNVIFDNGTGSVDAVESGFFKRYNRYYFTYKPDTLKHTLKFTALRDTVTLFNMKYEMPDENTVRLWSKNKGDSLFMQLRRTNRHFQLTERQFHWLSESNR